MANSVNKFPESQKKSPILIVIQLFFTKFTKLFKFEKISKIDLRFVSPTYRIKKIISSDYFSWVEKQKHSEIE